MGGRINVRTESKVHPCVLQDIGSLGTLPKMEEKEEQRRKERGKKENRKKGKNNVRKEERMKESMEGR